MSSSHAELNIPYAPGTEVTDLFIAKLVQDGLAERAARILATEDLDSTFSGPQDQQSAFRELNALRVSGGGEGLVRHVI